MTLEKQIYSIELLRKIVKDAKCLMIEETWTTCGPRQFWTPCSICEAKKFLKSLEAK